MGNSNVVVSAVAANALSGISNSIKDDIISIAIALPIKVLLIVIVLVLSIRNRLCALRINNPYSNNQTYQDLQ